MSSVTPNRREYRMDPELHALHTCEFSMVNTRVNRDPELRSTELCSDRH